jgi:hypothetical protein
MEQQMEQLLELVWNWFDLAFARDRLSNQWSWSGAGLTLHLPVVEQLLEQLLELVWTCRDPDFCPIWSD